MVRPFTRKPSANLVDMKSKEVDIIYGRHPVLEAIRSGRPMDKVVIQKGIRGPFEKEVRQLTREHNIPLQVAPRERMAKMVRGNHQGILGLVSPIRYYRLEDVLPGLFEKSVQPLVVVLDGVTDVRNLGAIARSAEGMGAHALVIAVKGSAQVNADAVKASAGALDRLPVCREPSMQKALDLLRMSGLRLLVSSVQANKAIYEEDLTGPVALVLGSEGEGVSRETEQKADALLKIPLVGQMESYNVSVAAGILLYEIVRQREGLSR